LFKRGGPTFTGFVEGTKLVIPVEFLEQRERNLEELFKYSDLKYTSSGLPFLFVEALRIYRIKACTPF
jgi:hypothetical protein